MQALGETAHLLNARPALVAQRALAGRLSARAPVQRAPAPNRTGLPDQLKAGIESLSGIAMDDVRVHRNSERPAQLQAHAYAQGTDIHLAPGQDRHLPHEAWHVVQQKQGRVRATMQMKAGVPVNDDRSLEAEADRMGSAALAHGGAAAGATQLKVAAPVVQRTINAVPDSWLGVHAPADSLRAQYLRPFLQDTITSSGDTVNKEIDRALWHLKPNAGQEHNYELWRRTLYRLRASIETFDGDRAAAKTLLEEIRTYTNLLYGAGAVHASNEWKLAASTLAPGEGVKVQWAGAAMIAIVMLPGATPTTRPTPKKLQISLDRHMWSRLTAGSQSKAQNTMLLNTVTEATVQKDMEDLGTQYLALMAQAKTSNVTLYRDAARKYFVERLTTEEPHVFPNGGSETAQLSQVQHEALKALKANPPANDGNWDTLVGAIAQGERQGVLDKLAELKFPRTTRDAFLAAMNRLVPPAPAPVAPARGNRRRH